MGQYLGPLKWPPLSCRQLFFFLNQNLSPIHSKTKQGMNPLLLRITFFGKPNRINWEEFFFGHVPGGPNLILGAHMVSSSTSCHTFLVRIDHAILNTNFLPNFLQHGFPLINQLFNLVPRTYGIYNALGNIGVRFVARTVNLLLSYAHKWRPLHQANSVTEWNDTWNGIFYDVSITVSVLWSKIHEVGLAYRVIWLLQ